MNIKLPRKAGLAIATFHVVEMFIGTITQIYTAREIGKLTVYLFNNVTSCMIFVVGYLLT